MLVAACNPSRYALLGVTGEHASCEDNLLSCLRALGHEVDPQPMNLFTNIPLSPQGELDWQPAVTAPGDCVVFRAEMDVIVCASSCPQDIVAIKDRHANDVDPMIFQRGGSPDDHFPACPHTYCAGRVRGHAHRGSSVFNIRGEDAPDRWPTATRW